MPMAQDVQDRGPRPRAVRLLAGLGGLMLVGWLAAYAVPGGRKMGLDFLFSFLLGLWLVGLFWWTSRHSGASPSLWRWLAAGWGMALLGNIAWGVYEMLTGKTLPLFSPLDLFYVARYVLVLLAFWRRPQRTKSRPWGEFLAVLLGATLLTWLLLFRPTLDSTDNALLVFLGGALYPILDVVLLYAALVSRWRATGRLRDALGLLALSMLSYGVANWINFSVRMEAFTAFSDLAGLFWLLSDVLGGLAALRVLW